MRPDNQRTCLLVILVLSMTGCAATHAKEHAMAVHGKTKVELLSCAGVPLREHQEGDLTFLTYSIEHGATTGMSRIGRGPGMLAGKPHQLAGKPHQLAGKSDQCEATVTLKDGKVTLVKYRSTAGSDDPCEPIFRGCADP